VDLKSDTFLPFPKWSSDYQKKFRDDNDQEDLKEWYNKYDNQDKKNLGQHAEMLHET